MDPLVSLYYYAPMCAAINAVVVWFSEWEAFSWEVVLRTGVGVLVLNAAGGFILNVVVFLLVCFPPFLSYISIYIYVYIYVYGQ